MESAVVRQLFPTACESGSHTEESRRRTTFGHPTVSDRIAQMVVKLSLNPKLSRAFYLILMATGRVNQHGMRWASRGSVVGATTGYLSLILRGCSTIYRTIYYLSGL